MKNRHSFGGSCWRRPSAFPRVDNRHTSRDKRRRIPCRYDESVNSRDRSDLAVGYGDNFAGCSSPGDQGCIRDRRSFIERQDAIFEQLCHQFGQRNRKTRFALSLRKDFDTD